MLTDAYSISTNSESRVDNDYYPTPPIAIYTLVKEYDLPKNLLEPAAGRGWISYELMQNGFNVTSQDLYEYEDPLVDIETGLDFTTSSRVDVDGIITNPPFKNSLPEKFVRRSYELYDFTALLCRNTFTESVGRYPFFKEFPPTDILIYANRINCSEKSIYNVKESLSGLTSYYWYIWDKRKDYTNRVDWINCKEYVDEFIAMRGNNYMGLQKPKNVIKETDKNNTLEEFFE